MDIKKTFFALADELDRHYVAPHITQTLLLSPDDYREVELALKELQDSGPTSAVYKTEGSYGEGWNSPTSEEMIHLSMGAYFWSIIKSEKSSLIWAVIKQ